MILIQGEPCRAPSIALTLENQDHVTLFMRRRYSKWLSCPSSDKCRFFQNVYKNPLHDVYLVVTKHIRIKQTIVYLCFSKFTGVAVLWNVKSLSADEANTNIDWVCTIRCATCQWKRDLKFE